MPALSMSETIPPGSPNAGDRYIPLSGAVSEWAGHDGEIASRDGGAWVFESPVHGWICRNLDDGDDTFEKKKRTSLVSVEVPSGSR